MLNIGTRTTPAQQATLRLLVDEADAIHSVTHNLDGLWLNVYFTAPDGDWVASIDRDGNLERTQWVSVSSRAVTDPHSMF